MSRVHNPRAPNSQAPVWFPPQKDISLHLTVEFIFDCRINLRDPASTDLDNGGNKECKQGNHKYDLRGGERGSIDHAEPSSPAIRAMIRKAIAQFIMSVLLTLRRCGQNSGASRRVPKAKSMEVDAAVLQQRGRLKSGTMRASRRS